MAKICYGCMTYTNFEGEWSISTYLMVHSKISITYVIDLIIIEFDLTKLIVDKKNLPEIP